MTKSRPPARLRLAGSKSPAYRWRWGLRGEAPNLDVGSPAAVKAAMLNAKSVKYSPTGAALMTVKKILSTLDIAAKIHDSSRVREEVPLAAGEYEINIYPLSEIHS